MTRWRLLQRSVTYSWAEDCLTCRWINWTRAIGSLPHAVGSQQVQHRRPGFRNARRHYDQAKGGTALTFTLHPVSLQNGVYSLVENTSVVPEYYAIRVTRPNNESEVRSYEIEFNASLTGTTHVLLQWADHQLPAGIDGQPVAIPLGDINGDGRGDFIASVKDQVGDFSQIFFNLHSD